MGTQSLYIPRQMFSPIYRGVSCEAKLLFSMLFNEATSAESIRETAALISRFDDDELNQLHEMKNYYMNVEEYIYV